ncbi:MAG TPA: beta-ketoacyl-ACP synthase II [Ktedonobacterales bacterium]|nr:beta-ketoacyl-ACP synthase II [Ktedonobacterales bacterium]
MSSRVVVTGMGMVTPLGNDVPTTWAAACRGASGIAPIAEFDTSGQEVTFGGEIKDFDATLYLDRKEARRNDRFVHFAVAATKQAIDQAKLDVAANGPDVGVLIGSGIGGLRTEHDQFKLLNERGPDRISPFFITMMISDIAAGFVSINFGAKGPNYAIVSACATSAHTIGEAYEIIRRGDAKAMIAGGSECALTPMGLAAFANMHALSRRNDDPQGASRPFDATRDGFVMSDGAGIVLLEDLGFAQARGAQIIAEVIGYAATADGYHITEPAPGGEGLVRAMQRAMQKACIRPEEVDYINAHGTSTPFNDRTETTSIKTAFGDHAHKLAVSSTKSMTGHTLGAAGGIEAIFSLLALQHGILPPTINLHHPDPDCDLDYVPNEARHQAINVAMSNSMGFGGHNACLIFKKYEG